METQHKQNKWHNFGDVNPRIHGGIFVKRDDITIEVVSITNNEENGGKGYTLQSDTYYVSDLIEEYETFKKKDQNTYRGVGSYADWRRYIELERKGWTIDDIVMHIAPDMLNYFGGEYTEQVSNYWKALNCYSIRPDRIQ